MLFNESSHQNVQAQQNPQKQIQGTSEQFGSNQERLNAIQYSTSGLDLPAGLTLQKGDKGENVKKLQQFLNTKGFDLTTDGIFGRGTQTAVRIFQQQNKLPTTGIVDSSLLSFLSSTSSSQNQDNSALQSIDLESRNVEKLNIDPSIFEDKGLRKGVFTLALQAFSTAFSNQKTDSLIFTIIDFELPSTQKRMWVIDLATKRLLYHEQVTHGRNSDKDNDGYVDKNGLSNVDMSKQSNIGLLKTAETYYSSKFSGTALRMDGLEEGFNDNARSRAIVMHPAEYANVREGQKMGRSWGCPALDPDVSGQIIERIKGGSLIFQYYPDEKWLQNSTYLQKN